MSTFRPLNDDEPPPNQVPVVRKFRNPDVAPGMKICGKCQQELPKNTDHFDRDSSKPSGFKGWCKKCRAERRAMTQAKEAAQMLEKLDLAIVANLAEAKPGGSCIPHQAEVYQNIMALMGGAQGLAMHFVSTYIAAKPGSMTRERMLGQINKMGASLSESAKVSPPTELMSDEEIEARLKESDERLKIVPAVVKDARSA